MKVELLRDGATESPLVRFYSPAGAAFTLLKRIVDGLRNGPENSREITAADEFDLVDIRQLVLEVGEGGMTEEVPGRLVWSLPARDWQAVSELLEPLCDVAATGTFQWLDEAGRGFSEGFAVLASVSEDGAW